MIRIRTMFSSMAAALLLLALVSATLAQAPGSGGAGGGGGRGGRGGGGFGFGGPGGRGGSIFGLLDNAAVQEDLKVTDKQKEQIKTANEAINKKRQALFAGMRGNNNNAGGANGAGGGNGGGGQRPDIETMRANMQELQAQTEATFAKILTKAQRSRLTQIDLQRQGPMAVLRPDIAEKLNVADDQMEEMQAIQNQSRDLMKQAFQSSRDAMPSFLNPDGTRDNVARQKYRDSPEAKTQMEQMRKQTDQLQNQTIAAIGKVLTRKQKDNFKKMQGKPFDLTKLGGPGGPGANNANADAATAADAADKTKAETKASTASKKKSTRKAARKTSAAS